VLFLDIRMSGLTGLDVARQAGSRCHVVFVTAYDQHAIAAFEQGAADFVLKPVTAARLATTVARLKERIGRPATPIDGVLRDLSPPRSSHLRWINASQGEAVRIITVDDVNYFQADSKYTRVVTAAEESLIRKPIKELAEELDPGCFWQIHRSTIVNVNAIAGVRRDLRGRPQVRLKSRSELLTVSDAYAYLFRQM
jgi:DNA-binding LytR/AlgR family response regulator